MSFTILDQMTGNAGWQDSSFNITQQDAETRLVFLDDKTWQAHMQSKEGAFKFIIQNFVFDPNNKDDILNGTPSKYPILCLGYTLMPLAVELSQWKYPVKLIINDSRQMKGVTVNSEQYAGEIDKIECYNYYLGVDSSRVIVFFDDDPYIDREHLADYLAYLKTRCQVLVIGLIDDGEIETILRHHKNVSFRGMSGPYHLFISYD